MMSVAANYKVVVVGAGPAGCYAALSLLKCGVFKDVSVYEKRPRDFEQEKGRNINITLCNRGIECLVALGIGVTGTNQECTRGQARNIPSVPMTHFKLHGQGTSLRLPYKNCMPSDINQQLWGRLMRGNEKGSAALPSVHSVQRRDLYYSLLEASERAGVKFHFEHEYISTELTPKEEQGDPWNVHSVHFGKKDGVKVAVPTAIVVGADGINSEVAKYISPEEEVIEYDKDASITEILRKYEGTRILEKCSVGYRELTIPYEVLFNCAVELDTLHIWSNDHMIVLGLPTYDRKLTIGVYTSAEKMKRISTKELIAEVIHSFPDLELCLSSVPSADLDLHGHSHRVGTLKTAINPHLVKDGVVLFGDAGHAMLPFLGQGLNSGLEDSQMFLNYIREWTYQRGERGGTIQSLHAAMARYNNMRKSNIFVIQQQSRCEMERMFAMRKTITQDINAASVVLSRFFYFCCFTTTQYCQAWIKSQPKRIAVGTTVKEGDVLAQVESVKTLISVVAPCSGKITGVREKSQGMPIYEITPASSDGKKTSLKSSESGTVVMEANISSGPESVVKPKFEIHTVDSSTIWDTQKEAAPFKLPDFQASLKTGYVGRCLVYTEKTGSTMDDARTLSEKACIHGTACLSETMTAGRGRQDNTWTAPPKGNIYVTFVLKLKQECENQLPKIQFAAGVAVCKAMREAGVHDAVVKWPNDVWVRGRKVAGILVEVFRSAVVKAEVPTFTAVLVGIGINVNDNPSLNANLREKATSVANELGHLASRETLLACVCNHLERLCDQEVEEILQEFQTMHIWTPGSEVEVIPRDSPPYCGSFEKVDVDATLQIKESSGVVKNLKDMGLSVRPLPKSVAYVYSGEGCSQQSLHMLFSSLKMLVDTSKYMVKLIGAATLLDAKWLNDAAMIAFVGGYDCGYITSLGDEGVKLVKTFVENGGSYLGICAGGYFGCQEIEFDKGGPLEVCAKRDLGFFQGKCIGPVFPGFKYNSEEGAHAAEVSWRLAQEDGDTAEKRIHTYFNGGGAFIFPDFTSSQEADDTEIVARYATVPGNPAAVVKRKFGKGTVVLSGVHFEYVPQDLLAQGEANLKEIVPKLLESQDDCMKCFKSVLKQLSVY